MLVNLVLSKVNAFHSEAACHGKNGHVSKSSNNENDDAAEPEPTEIQDATADANAENAFAEGRDSRKGEGSL